MTDRFKGHFSHLVAIPLMTIAALPSMAGGLYVGEFGQPNQGASRAGAHALAEDASTAAQNPAGIMFLDGDETMVTGIVVNSEIEFDQDNQLSSSAPAVAKADGSRPASNGGDQGGWAFGAAQFHAEQISDKWAGVFHWSLFLRQYLTLMIKTILPDGTGRQK